jgi:hypothetical protein
MWPQHPIFSYNVQLNGWNWHLLLFVMHVKHYKVLTLATLVSFLDYSTGSSNQSNSYAAGKVRAGNINSESTYWKNTITYLLNLFTISLTVSNKKWYIFLRERVLEKEFSFFICHIQQSIHKYKINFCLMNLIQKYIPTKGKVCACTRGIKL